MCNYTNKAEITVKINSLNAVSKYTHTLYIRSHQWNGFLYRGNSKMQQTKHSTLARDRYKCKWVAIQGLVGMIMNQHKF